MRRVTGIGGVFFKAKDPKALGEWYRKHLGMDIQDWGGVAFRWSDTGNPTGTGSTIWSPFNAETSYFSPSSAPFMINYRVADLKALIAALREEGCQVDDKVEEWPLVVPCGIEAQNHWSSSSPVGMWAGCI